MKKFICLVAMLWSVPLWAANTATLSWGAVTQYTDGSAITGPVTYSVYWGVQGAAKTLLQSGVTATGLAVSAGLQSGTTVCFEVTATAGGQESARSSEACKTFPPQVPTAPVLVVK